MKVAKPRRGRAWGRCSGKCEMPSAHIPPPHVSLVSLGIPRTRFVHSRDILVPFSLRCFLFCFLLVHFPLPVKQGVLCGTLMKEAAFTGRGNAARRRAARRLPTFSPDILILDQAFEKGCRRDRSQVCARVHCSGYTQYLWFIMSSLYASCYPFFGCRRSGEVDTWIESKLQK